MKGVEEFISRERGFGIRDPKRIKTEKSEPDAGTKGETVASELSGKADLTESQIHEVLSFLSLHPSAASNVTLRRSLRKNGNLSSTQLVVLDVLDCVDEIQHKRERMLEYHEAASDPRFSPALSRLYQARASRLGIEWLYLKEDRLPQLKSDLDVALTVAAQQTEPIPPGWKCGKLALKSTPNGRTPAVFAFGRKTYTVPSGNAWRTVCAMIHADAFDGHGMKMKTPSGFFKREHRTFFSDRMTKNDSGWFIKTQ